MYYKHVSVFQYLKKLAIIIIVWHTLAASWTTGSIQPTHADDPLLVRYSLLLLVSEKIDHYSREVTVWGGVWWMGTQGMGQNCIVCQPREGCNACNTCMVAALRPRCHLPTHYGLLAYPARDSITGRLLPGGTRSPPDPSSEWPRRWLQSGSSVSAAKPHTNTCMQVLMHACLLRAAQALRQ